MNTHPKRRFPWFSLFVVLGLIITNFLIQIGVEPSYKNMSTDSGTFAYCGWLVSEGGLMYRDCWDNKPPGVYYLNALAIHLAGANPFAIWLFQAAWLTLALLAYFWILGKVWRRSLAALASFGLVLILLFPDIFQGGNLTETYAILPVVLALGAFWAYLRTGEKKWVSALGFLLGAGILLKPTYIATAGAALFVVLYFDLLKGNLKSFLRHLGLLSFSAILPLALVSLFWIWQGDFRELLFAVFIHNFRYVESGFSLQSLYGSARLFLVHQPMACLTGLAVVSFGLFLYRDARKLRLPRNNRSQNPDLYTPGCMDASQSRIWWQAGIGLALILDFLFLAAPGKNFGHYLQVLLPGMVASVLYLVDVLSSALHQNRRLQAWPVVGAILALILVIPAGVAIAQREAPSPAELKAFFSAPDLRLYQPNALEQFIIDHSRPSDRVLIWAGHPSMNFLTQRSSPTRYIFLQHLFTPTLYDQNGFTEFLQELNREPPKLIVAQPVSSAGLPFFDAPAGQLCEDCSPALQEKMQAFKHFVDENYQLSYTIWDWVVFEQAH